MLERRGMRSVRSKGRELRRLNARNGRKRRDLPRCKGNWSKRDEKWRRNERGKPRRIDLLESKSSQDKEKRSSSSELKSLKSPPFLMTMTKRQFRSHLSLNP